MSFENLLDQYGWSESVAQRVAGVGQPGAHPGRIARVDRGSALLATAEDMVEAVPASELAQGGIAVGDWVVWRGDDRTGRMVVAVAERTSAIVRRDPSPADNRDQVLAANLDSAFVLYRLDRKLRPAVLERYLVLIWDSGVRPVIVLSKSDLASRSAVAAAVREARSAAPDVPVVATSATGGSGLPELAPYLTPGASVALMGESGVGKSTLVNALVGEDLMETAVTRTDGRGRHTTVAREMVPLGNGAVLIDTPGLRSVGLAAAEDGLARVFADIEDLVGFCKFRDCAHDGEPGCAVATAIEHGVLDERRLASYRRLLEEQQRLAERTAAIERRAQRGRRS